MENQTAKKIIINHAADILIEVARRMRSGEGSYPYNGNEAIKVFGWGYGETPLEDQRELVWDFAHSLNEAGPLTKEVEEAFRVLTGNTLSKGGLVL